MSFRDWLGRKDNDIQLDEDVARFIDPYDDVDRIQDGDKVAVDLGAVFEKTRVVMQRIEMAPQEAIRLDSITSPETWYAVVQAGLAPMVVSHIATTAREIVAFRHPWLFDDREFDIEHADPLAGAEVVGTVDYSELPAAKKVLDDEFNGRPSRLDEVVEGMEPIQLISLLNGALITYGWIVYQLADPDIVAQLRQL